MMRHIHIDCFSGVSGNMLLGALLDAGFPEQDLHRTLNSLPLDHYRIALTRKIVKGFSAYEVRVESNKSHHHRHLADIESILQQANLDPTITNGALQVFRHLAEAEAAVHDTTPDTIHFHEVGAVDAIVDIVGVMAGFHFLAPATVSCSPLPMPNGWVNCEHGEIPLPAPAVCELLKGVPVYGEMLQQELVTPTGAALVRELATDFGHMPPMILEKTAYGAGTMERADGRPNLLRLHLGESMEVAETQHVDVLETHIDDWNPELWPFISNKIMEAGALDVSLFPMHMKKGRPGFLLRTICEPARTPMLRTILFNETGTIGIRCRKEQRTTLKREAVTIETKWGPIAAKQVHTPSGITVTPEYEACKQVALEHDIPLQEVYATVTRLSFG